MYALDTNTVIYFFNGKGCVAENLLQKRPQDIYLPSIVVFEIEYGLQKSIKKKKKFIQFKKFLDCCHLVPFEKRAASIAAGIRFELEKKGQTIGPYDILIAAAALATGLILVTHNVKEFKRIRNLQIEDWY